MSGGFSGAGGLAHVAEHDAPGAGHRRITDGLRIDLLGSGIRVCTVDPGMVETEFSLVRFRGDSKRAAEVYRGTRPLNGDDIAEVVLFAATRPPHVAIADVLVLPTDQAAATHVHRQE